MFACAVTKAGALATSSKQHSFKKFYGDQSDNWNDHNTKQNKDSTAPTHTQKQRQQTQERQHTQERKHTHRAKQRQQYTSKKKRGRLSHCLRLSHIRTSHARQPVCKPFWSELI